ncbi:MAG: polyphosphate kinase 2 [Planctomycetota bacterium]
MSKKHKHKPNKMSREDYDEELLRLQTELTYLQRWVKQKGLKIAVIFEGRDTAGKGGMIKRITERVSPRVFRVVALPTPTEREKSQFYFQRYFSHLPAAGEIVLFDRSWYNRAGVERVMGFCTEKEYDDFMRVIPGFERELVNSGIILIKYFLDVSQEEQRRRFEGRINTPMKHWKLSPVDLEAVPRWWEYSEAFAKMIQETDQPACPWYIVPADDKRRARLNLITHFLKLIDYEKIPFDAPTLPEPPEKPDGMPDHLPMSGNIIEQVF